MGDANVSGDQLVVIKIEGMHCHKCEQTIQKALLQYPGVHEVETDFASGQASVLFDRKAVKVTQLMTAINDGGYRATSFVQGKAKR